MDDARIEKIRNSLNTPPEYKGGYLDRSDSAVDDIRDLLAEVERLKGENARLRKIIRSIPVCYSCDAHEDANWEMEKGAKHDLK